MKYRMKQNFKTILQVLLIVLLILLCLLFLKSRVTYTSYESNVDGKIVSPIASWKIKIDGKDITTEEATTGIKIDNIKWNTKNAREGKVAPGSDGSMTIKIDSSGTDVAIYYEFEYIDKDIDETKHLKITDMKFNNVILRRIDSNKFAGILTLDDIRSGIMPEVVVNVIWESDEDIVYDPETVNDLDSFLVFNFMAKQYRGEELPPEYVEGA